MWTMGTSFHQWRFELLPLLWQWHDSGAAPAFMVNPGEYVSSVQCRAKDHTIQRGDGAYSDLKAPTQEGRHDPQGYHLPPHSKANTGTHTGPSAGAHAATTPEPTTTITPAPTQHTATQLLIIIEARYDQAFYRVCSFVRSLGYFLAEHWYALNVAGGMYILRAAVDNLNSVHIPRCPRSTYQVVQYEGDPVYVYMLSYYAGAT